jgi:hypothetical protein
MTLLWFVVWLISNLAGDEESLTFDPVNWWAGTLLPALAVDLGRQHAGPFVPKGQRPSSRSSSMAGRRSSSPGSSDPHGQRGT